MRKASARKRLEMVEQGYSVLLGLDNSRGPFFAHSGQGRAFFYRWRDALAYKRDLAEHNLRGRVVQVTVTMAERKRSG